MKHKSRFLCFMYFYNKVWEKEEIFLFILLVHVEGFLKTSEGSMVGVIQLQTYHILNDIYIYIA